MLKDAVILQKREFEKKVSESYILRTARTIAWKSDMIKVIIGPRRAGKSFFGMHKLAELGKVGYVNFDDEELAEANDYNEIIILVNEVYDNPTYILFDEVQNLNKWELFINRLQRQGHNIIITGSNSNLLSRELSSHLTGRYIQLAIMPFSFKEWFGSNKHTMTTAEVRQKLATYLENGGYPEPLVKNLDYKDYLSTLFDSVIYKDIVKRYNVKNGYAIDYLAKYLLSNIASEFSYNSLVDVTKCKSNKTAEKYVKYLEDAFLFFSLSRFSYKLKQQISSNKKIYCIDNGFISGKAFRIGSAKGRMYENAVAIELKKKEIESKISLFYWKNQQQEEVDFVVREGTKIKQLIQVCFDVAEPRVKERECRALLKASAELRCNDLLVITDDYETSEKIEWFGKKGTIRFVPLYKWLLNEN